jgi:hypothetical protein
MLMRMKWQFGCDVIPLVVVNTVYGSDLNSEIMEVK